MPSKANNKINNNIENYKVPVNIWEDPEFCAFYVSSPIGDMMLNHLPRDVRAQLTTSKPNIESKNTLLKYAYMPQYDQNSNTVKGLDTWVEASQTISNGQLNVANKYIDKLKKENLNQASKRGDSRLKTYYMDNASMLDSEAGNITETIFTSPYIDGLLHIRGELASPLGSSSAEQKLGLTQPLYEAIYDFEHAVANEVAVDFNRQKYEASEKGWTSGAKDAYLKQLHRSHTDLLEQFNKLSKFKDDPQNNTAHFIPHKLESIFRVDDNSRNIYSKIGFIRGEKKAIENGWGKDDLFILGMVGSIEEEMKAQARSNNETDFINSLPQFKSDFTKLKNECFFTTVSTPSDKREIADKVKAFIESQDSEAAKKCMARVKDYMAKFEEVCSSIQEQEERGKQKVVAKKNEIKNENNNIKPIEGDFEVIPLNTNNYNLDNPDEIKNLRLTNKKKQEDVGAYLNDLLSKGKTKYFFREYTDSVVKAARFRAKVGTDIDSSDTLKEKEQRDAKEDERRIALLTGELASVGGASNKVLMKEAAENYFDLVLACANEEEQLIEDLKAGREKLDTSSLYDGANKDYSVCKAYAKQTLINSDLNQKRRAAKEIFKAVSAYFTDELEEIKEDYARNCTEVLDERHISALLNDSLEDIEVNDINKHDVFKNVVAEAKPIKLKDTKFIEALKTKKIGLDKFKNINESAKDLLGTKLNEATLLGNHKPTAVYNNEKKKYVSASDATVVVDPNKANSQAYVNLLNALNRVRGLTNDNTPLETLEAYRYLRDAAKAYNNKIDAKTFAGRRENGKARRRLSGEVFSTADSTIKQLEGTISNIELETSISKQEAELESTKTAARTAFNEKIQQYIDESKPIISSRFDYNENPGRKYQKANPGLSDEALRLKFNRDYLMLGIVEGYIIYSLEMNMGKDGAYPIPPTDINESYLENRIKVIMGTNTYRKLKDSFKTEADVKKTMEQLKNNPKLAIEKFNSFKKENDKSLEAEENVNNKRNKNIEQEINNNNNIINM